MPHRRPKTRKRVFHCGLLATLKKIRWPKSTLRIFFARQQPLPHALQYPSTNESVGKRLHWSRLECMAGKMVVVGTRRVCKYVYFVRQNAVPGQPVFSQDNNPSHMHCSAPRPKKSGGEPSALIPCWICETCSQVKHVCGGFGRTKCVFKVKICFCKVNPLLHRGK